MTFQFCRIAGEQLHKCLAPHVPSQEDKWKWREQDLPRVSQYTYLGIHLLMVVDGMCIFIWYWRVVERLLSYIVL